jgi:hypothetical protein
MKSLAQKTCDMIAGFIVDHSFPFIILCLFLVLCADFYYRFVQVIKTNDTVDLMYRYTWLQLRRRYGQKI